jgi:uncharacterized protein (TIGR02444 family)
MQPESGKGEAAGEAFWRFSLALYTRPGAAGALIALQDRSGCDVNLVLFGMWLGVTRGWCIDAAGLAAAAAEIAALNSVTSELRALRRRLIATADPDLAALRREVAAVELTAERRIQQRLAARATRGATEGDRLAAAEANLALCLADAAGSAEAAVLRSTLQSLMRDSRSA